eukprot:NODE_3191_length_377_cov_47.176829_g3109_i0.p2 GENE.NODE_3191_length_377_cov_47.176829_g3109_i0~~NODE_3191_length_377_cov_47.176829_g3109_i0.p2  ORF type:complete len:66 (+),score=18.90 NODE_3191_length_377_cov_47.176829_g3109_i0:24-200(+)
MGLLDKVGFKTVMTHRMAWFVLPSLVETANKKTKKMSHFFFLQPLNLFKADYRILLRT